MSIGKILDQFKSGEITKQEAVTKLQKNRNRHAAQEANKAAIAELEEVKKYFPEYATSATAQLLLCVNNRIVILESQLTADKEQGSMNTIKLDNSDFVDFTDEVDDEDNY